MCSGSLPISIICYVGVRACFLLLCMISQMSIGVNRNWKPTGQPVSSCRFTPSLFFASLFCVTVTYSFVGPNVRANACVCLECLSVRFRQFKKDILPGWSRATLIQDCPYQSLRAWFKQLCFLTVGERKLPNQQKSRSQTLNNFATCTSHTPSTW